MTGYTARKRETNRAWDAENMSTISCRVRRGIADQMRQIAQMEGTTPAALLRAFVLDYVEAHGGDISAQVSARGRQQDHQSADDQGPEDQDPGQQS